MSQKKRILSGMLRRVSEAIISWQRQQGRKYPWRDSNNPYEILIAEMMLRRTTAMAVSRVYPLFIDTYKSSNELASAPIGSISRLVAPLGLQTTRSRHLKEIARIITEEHRGEVPSDSESLRALPGVGDYIAAAVRNFAFRKPEPLVDNNVVHLLSRIFETSFSGPNDTKAWEFMKRFGGPSHEPRLYWGIIDLVASTCKRRNPRCTSCPVADLCRWRRGHVDPLEPRS